MVAAVDQANGAIDDRETQWPPGHRLAHAFLDGRDPLFGHRPAVDLLLEVEALATAQRTDFDDHVAELAMPARLLLVAAMLTHRLADGFAIANRRRVALHLDAIAALQPCQHGIEMFVVHAAKANLVGGVVMLDDEAGILLDEALQRA